MEYNILSQCNQLNVITCRLHQRADIQLQTLQNPVIHNAIAVQQVSKQIILLQRLEIVLGNSHCAAALHVAYYFEHKYLYEAFIKARLSLLSVIISSGKPYDNTL